MSKTIYINLPVKDTAAARDFYTKVGFQVKEEFSNPVSETAVIADNILILLVREEGFKEASKREVADTTSVAEVTLAVEVEGQEEVDKIVDSANAAGAKEVGEAFEHEGMYTRIFRDLDGHQFNIFAFLQD